MSYTDALFVLSTTRERVDKFFDKVMVMVEDEKVRANRLALLQTLFKEFSTIADFSEIVTEGSKNLQNNKGRIMATTTLPEVETKQPKTSGTKYVYSFGGGKADGDGKMKDVLGGKGAGLAEMTNAGLPVPPGFTIQTEACREYMETGKRSEEVNKQMDAALAQPGKVAGPEAGQGRQSVAGERTFGREVLHARNDGYDPEPRLER